MENYIMTLKSGWFAHPNLRNTSDIVFKTKASNLSEAKEYFIRLKDLPEKKFDELFMVIKANGNDE